MRLPGKKHKVAIDKLIGYFLHPKKNKTKQNKKSMIVFESGYPNQSRVSDSNAVKSIYGQ